MMSLVTGGCGFIGSALVKELVRRGKIVRVLDDMSRGNGQRLAGLPVNIIDGDVRDIITARLAACGATEVYHLAAINGTENFYKRPGDVLNVGVRGALNIIDACWPDSKLLIASSSEVYQTPDKIPTDETATYSIPDPYNPRYSYAATKIISEMLALYCTQHLQKAVIVRPHNIYGPDMGNEHVIPQMLNRIKRDGHLEFYGDEPPRNIGPTRVFWGGGQTRSFCHVKDCVDGMILAMEKGEHRSIYNIGTSEEVPISELATKIAALAKCSIVMKNEPTTSKGGTERRCPDISKLMALGYTPTVSLDVGLEETVNWYLR